MDKPKIVKLSQNFSAARLRNQAGSAPQAPKAGQAGHN